MTLAIFVVLATFLLMAVKEVVATWTTGERRRVLYERAAGCVDVMADDIRLALTREPPGSNEAKARFIADLDPETRAQRLMFVRTFESGPERALTARAGDGSPNSELFRPDAESGKIATTGTAARPDSEDYVSGKVGDFKPLGGMAMVAYFVKDRTLYRAVKAPVQGPMTALISTSIAQPVANDVLYMNLEYWSQDTELWDPPKGSKTPGPLRIWDSTRGISKGPLKEFYLGRGDTSLNDPEDDVFPRKMRITLTVDSPSPRCIFTNIEEEIGEGDTTIYVRSTKGFRDDDEEDNYILIDDEWMRYKQKREDLFVIEKRGVRGTEPRAHKKGAEVRQGRTFRRIVFIPNFREDFTTDEEYYRRKALRSGKKRSTP